MRNFEGEETIRGRRVNVLSGLELHKRLLSGPEERQMVEHIRSWVAAVRRLRRQCCVEVTACQGCRVGVLRPGASSC
jgi:hypothetical protein